MLPIDGIDRPEASLRRSDLRLSGGRERAAGSQPLDFEASKTLILEKHGLLVYQQDKMVPCAAGLSLNSCSEAVLTACRSLKLGPESDGPNENQVTHDQGW